jgi:hypothetical protein
LQKRLLPSFGLFGNSHLHKRCRVQKSFTICSLLAAPAPHQPPWARYLAGNIPCLTVNEGRLNGQSIASMRLDKRSFLRQAYALKVG